MNLLSDLIFIALGIAAAWWLSGYDPRVTGEDPKADLIQRVVRVSITAVLLSSVMINGSIAIFCFLSIGIYWANCGSEFLSHLFHKAIDPEDKRPFDPKETVRNLDLLARFVREGRTREALDLCKQLETAADASPMALDATLYHLYQNILESISTSPVLAEPRRLRELGRFNEAEASLKRILDGQPENWPAMLLLMRVYSQDLRRPDQALAFIAPLDKKKPQLHRAFIKYAKRSIEEWCAARSEGKGNQNEPAAPGVVDSAPAAPVAVAEVSVDELLKNGRLTAAIGMLENMTREQPKNFDAWMRFAEAHANYCRDFKRAEKIVRTMELSGNFTPQEIQQARAKVREWQVAHR